MTNALIAIIVGTLAGTIAGILASQHTEERDPRDRWY